MPLSDAEKERIREAEILKDEIRKELQPPKLTSGLSDFKKQASLLVIGFFLTTAAGGALTAWWKARDSSNERSYIAQRGALDKTYGIIDKTAKEVALTIAAADDVLATYYGDEWTAKEIEERRANWTNASRNWRVNCQVLAEEIHATFSNPEIDQIFEQIVDKRRVLGNYITNLPRGKRGSKQELREQLREANQLKLEIIELLHTLGARMTVLAKQGMVQ